MRVKLFFDGGYRPAGMETAVVVRGRAHLQQRLGAGSSLEAEWLALIHALRIGQALGLADMLILGDCITVVNQANGTAPCRGAGVRHLQTVRDLAPAGLPCIRYIRRAQNLAGIALARSHDR